MKQLKNHSNETLETKKAIEGFHCIVVMQHETINTALDADDIDLTKINVTIKDRGDNHTIFSGTLKKFALGAKVGNRCIDNIVTEVGEDLVTEGAAAYNKSYFILDVPFSAYKGNVIAEVSVKDLFHADVDASSSVWVDFDYSDDVAVGRDYYESYAIQDGKDSDVFKLGDGVEFIAIASYVSNATEQTSAMELSHMNLSSDSLSLNRPVDVIKALTDQESEDSESKHNNLILHHGELINDVVLNLDFTEANIVAGSAFVVVKKVLYSETRAMVAEAEKEIEDSKKLAKVITE